MKWAGGDAMRTPTDMAQYKRLHSANEAYVYALERDLYSAPTVRRQPWLSVDEAVWLTALSLLLLVAVVFLALSAGRVL